MTKTDSDKPKKKDAKPRIPRKVTPSSLRNIALHHLERFATSTKGLRDVLQRRVYRSARHHDIDEAEAALWIDDIIQRFQDVGLLDDQAYGTARAKSLHDRGLSNRMVRLKLAQKGLDGDIIDQAMASLETDHEEPEFEAALTYARKKRIGPYRLPEKRAEMREKDLAAMARTGFSYDMAQTIIDAEAIDELEDRHRDGLNTFGLGHR